MLNDLREKMKEIDPERLPRHVAIIMDGNGRWAESHALGRVMGHRKGAESVRVAVKTCRELGIRYLTLYAFSTENWNRPQTEVSALLKLLGEYLDNEVQGLMDQDIRLAAVGCLESLGESVLAKLREATARTAGNQSMVLNLALSYGGRDELTAAVNRMVADALAGKLAPQAITQESVAGYLYTAGMPDPDLLIRTGGECRISNFLLWQMAYTEFYFTEVLWPDFRESHLLKAVAEYQRRERRFGMTSGQIRK
ncbi:MAG: isoprenyl transferase [Deltaproteobacteria bacterium]|nr:isoprenyl transferase [Deltaproteobacteria bacterium]